MSQKFCNIFVTYLLYSSSYNKSSQAFKIEAIMFPHLKQPFCQFFDPKLIPVLILWGEELLHQSFHFLLVVKASWIQEVSYRSEGTRSRLYAKWSHLFTSLLIPSSYQFLSFEVKNSFTEAFTSSWLLKCHEYKKWVIDPRELGPHDMLNEATFLPVCWSQADTSSYPLRWRTPSLKLPPPLGCWSVMNTRSEL